MDYSKYFLTDETHWFLIRENIVKLIKETSEKYDDLTNLILEIAPQKYTDVKRFYEKSAILTLDINPESGADYIGDICKKNDQIEDNLFDMVIATEILEHTYEPWNAVKEIYRILRPMGVVVVSVPFNFRIHGPLPDCYRFTEHGLRYLFKEFENVKIEILETTDRKLMPIHYTLTASKPL